MRCIPLVSWHSSAIEMIIHFSFSIRMLAGLYVNDILSILIFLFLSFLDFFSQFKKKKEVVTSGLTWRDTDASSSKSREQFKELRECLTPNGSSLFPRTYVSLSSSLFYSHRSPSTFFLLTFEILNAHDKHQE